MSDTKEYFKVPARMRELVVEELSNAGKREPQDYALVENEFNNSVMISTNDTGIKKILLSNNCTNLGEVDTHLIVDGSEVVQEDKYLVSGGYSKDDVISALEDSEGGSKYRFGVNFDVQENKDGKLYLEPIGNAQENQDLHDLLTSNSSPIKAVYLAVSPTKESKKRKA